MKCSDAGRALIMQCEGCQLEAYHGAADRPGLYTIGYGHTGGGYAYAVQQKGD